MIGEGLYITRFSAWAPGIAAAAEWDEWARGEREIQSGSKGPEIAFTDTMFRRRLSQISKMTIQVVHDLLPVDEDTKMIFLSFRGELAKQYTVNRMLIEDHALMPAAFSLSVFNAPIALASMALGLKGGYTALYPGNNSFATGLAAAQAMLLSEMKDQLVFVYADEEIPSEYANIFSDKFAPFAFGFLLNRSAGPDAIALSSCDTGKARPEDFLRNLILCGKMHVSP